MLSPLVNKSEKFVINQLTKNIKKFEEEINSFSNGNYGKIFYNEYNCYNPFRTIQIMPNGSVHPCCPTMYLDDFIMGNIKKQSLIEIFNSNKFKEFRKNVKEKKLDVCKTCRYNQKENYQLSKVLN
jgi:radical SAM protein with 4Fe4S-binding SPASM domain